MIIQKESRFHPDFHETARENEVHEMSLIDKPCDHHHDHHHQHHHHECGPLPGTILRLFIPAGATLNVLNLIELTSPSGICFIVRLPFLGGDADAARITDMDSLIDAVNRVGGRVEFVE